MATPLPSRQWPERQRGQRDAQWTPSAGEATLSPGLSYGARDAIRWVPECPSSPAVPAEQPVEPPRAPSASSIRARACYSIQRKGVLRTVTDTVDGVGVWAHDRIVAYFSDSSWSSTTIKSDGPTAGPVRTGLAAQDAAGVAGDLAARTAAAADADACTDRIGQCHGPGPGPEGFAAASHYHAAAVTPRADWRRAAS